MTDENRNFEDECGDHGGNNRDGDPCGRPAGWGTDFDSGKCKHHRGTNSDGSSHANNGNALKHGATADPTNLYDHLTPDQQEWVETRVKAYVDQSPTLTMDDPRVGRVEIAVIMMLQERFARGVLLQEEMAQNRVVGVTDDGRPIEVEDSHYLNPVASSLNTDIRMTLKDAGLLDDPESQKATEMGNIADVWRSELDRGSSD